MKRRLAGVSSAFVVAGLIGGLASIVAGCGGNGTTPTDAGGNDTAMGTGGRTVTPDGGTGGRVTGTGGAGGGNPGGTGGAAPTTGIQITVTPPATTIREGEMQTIMVGLMEDARSQITVTVVSSDQGVARPQQDTVTFETGERGPKSVVIVAQQDNDLANETANLTFSGEGTRPAMVRVQVTDDDRQQIVLAPTATTTLREGATQSVSVTLRYQPAAPVTVNVTSASAAKLTATPAALTFDPDNYSTPQSVVLSALQDNDAVSETVNVTFATAAEPPAPATLMVAITDDDVLNILVAEPRLDLVEGSRPTGTLMVSLTIAPPGGSVAVSVASSDSAKVTVTPATLTFTAANFGTPQPVTVTALADDADNRDDNHTITLTAPGAEKPLTVPVSVADDDDQAILVNPSMIALTEGAAMMLSVRLAFPPSSPATVNVFSSNGSKIEISPSALVFTAANFNTFQQVMVQSLEDEDLASENVSLTLISTEAGSRTLNVAVTDNDMQQILLVNTSEPLQMQEGRPGSPSTATIGVRLSNRPAAAVTMTIASSDPTKLSIGSGSILIFDPTDYAVPRFLVLTANDESDLTNDEVMVTFTASAIPTKTLGVQITDTDVQGIRITQASSNPLVVGEATTGDTGTCGANVSATRMATFSLSLNFAPTADTRLDLTTMPGLNAGFTVTPAFVTIPVANTPQLITVTATADCDTRGGAGNIHVAAAAGGPPPLEVGVMVNDEDVMQLVLTPGTNTVVSSGTITATVTENSDDVVAPSEQATFRVRLSKNPTAPVNVGFVQSPSGVVLLAPSSQTVTPATSGTPPEFTVTITGLDDVNLVPDGTSIRVTAPGIGVADQFVAVNEIDDDTQGLVVEPPVNNTIQEEPDGNVSDPPRRRTFRVRLTKLPVTATTVSVSVPQAQAGSFQVSADDTSYSNSVELAFNPGAAMGSPGHFETFQTVYIKAIADENTDNEMAFINVSNPSFASNQTVTVLSADIDRQELIIIDDLTSAPVGELALTERTQTAGAPVADCTTPGGLMNCPRLLRVRLRFPPNGGGSEVVTVTNPSSRIQVSATTLTFNNTLNVPGSSWNTDHLITIKPVQDNDIQDHNDLAVTFHSTQDPIPAGAAAEDRVLNVDVDDLDTQMLLFSGTGLTGSPQTITIAEGAVNNSAVRLRLAADPLGTNVTVTCTSADETKVTIGGGGMYTFTGGASGSWDDLQIISLTLPQDNADAINDTIAISCQAMGGTPAPVPAVTGGFTVNQTDNDRVLTVVPTAGGDVDAVGGSIMDCRSSGGMCSSVYTVGTDVMLSAAPDVDWVFGGWTGTGCASEFDPSITVDMAANRTCSVAFRPQMTVTVVGMGTVDANPNMGGGQIMTTTMLTDDFALGALVTMTTTPTAGWMFSAWSGEGCGATVTMSGPHHCTATFVPVPPPPIDP